LGEQTLLSVEVHHVELNQSSGWPTSNPETEPGPVSIFKIGSFTIPVRPNIKFEIRFPLEIRRRETYVLPEHARDAASSKLDISKVPTLEVRENGEPGNLEVLRFFFHLVLSNFHSPRGEKFKRCKKKHFHFTEQSCLNERGGMGKPEFVPPLSLRS
jgi:hypothetical protein